MTTAVKNPFINLSVDGSALSVDQFIGTIIKSSWDVRDNGLFWNLVVFDEEASRFERASGVRNVDINQTGRVRYKSSNKYKILHAFEQAGFPADILKEMGAGDFEGLRFLFKIDRKENNGGFPDTVLFLPIQQLDNAEPSDVAELKRRYEARIQGGGNGRAANRQVDTPAPTIVSVYTGDQVIEAATLLDGLARSNRSAVAAAAGHAKDEQVRQGIIDGTLITQAISHGALGVGDDGLYHSAIN